MASYKVVISGLAEDPRPMGAEKLSGTRDKYRIRQGNYRVLYEIEDDVLTVNSAQQVTQPPQ